MLIVIIRTEEHLVGFDIGGLDDLQKVEEGLGGDFCAELLEGEVGNVSQETLGLG